MEVSIYGEQVDSFDAAGYEQQISLVVSPKSGSMSPYPGIYGHKLSNISMCTLYGTLLYSLL